MILKHVPEPEHTDQITKRQAKAISRLKPDIILFEHPREEEFKEFNRHKPANKPFEEIKKWKESLKNASKRYPWLKSAHKIVEAIEELWNKGKQVLLYSIDGPVELTSATWTKGIHNMAWNYLREKYMVEKIKELSRRMKRKKALVLCHDFHWKNIRFLLTKPSKEEIWNHYFRKVTNKTKKEAIKEIKENKVLYKHWKLKSGFKISNRQ